MEFEFAIPWPAGQPRTSVKDQPCICTWTADELRHASTLEFHQLRLAVERFGALSARAQGLPGPITDIQRLCTAGQALLLCVPHPGSNVLIGGLKTGRKRLFIRRESGSLVEMEPVCVLDFYVHEACQRSGVGRRLLEHVLAAEGVGPEQLAYDRPSRKLLAFLARHYGLSSYVPQNNNYVVFDRYFDREPPRDLAREPPRRGPARQQAQVTVSPAACFGGASEEWDKAGLSGGGGGGGGGGGDGRAAQRPQGEVASGGARYWGSVMQRPLTGEACAAPGAREAAAALAAAPRAPGAGGRQAVASPAHAFPRGDWTIYPSGACGGTGFAGVSQHPMRLGAAGAPWGAVLSHCSTTAPGSRGTRGGGGGGGGGSGSGGSRGSGGMGSRSSGGGGGGGGGGGAFGDSVGPSHHDDGGDSLDGFASSVLLGDAGGSRQPSAPSGDAGRGGVGARGYHVQGDAAAGAWGHGGGGRNAAGQEPCDVGAGGPGAYGGDRGGRASGGGSEWAEQRQASPAAADAWRARAPKGGEWAAAQPDGQEGRADQRWHAGGGGGGGGAEAWERGGRGGGGQAAAAAAGQGQARASYPYPPFRTMADGGIDYSPPTPPLAQLTSRVPGATMRDALPPGPPEMLPAAQCLPAMSTLQVAALRERGRLPPHALGTSVLPTSGMAAAHPEVRRRGDICRNSSAGSAGFGSGGGAAGRLDGGGDGRSGGSDGGRRMSGASVGAAAAASDLWQSRLATPVSAKLAAAAQRSGRGAASCLRYEW